MRVWASLERLVGTVTDQGDGLDDPLAGYLPSRGRDPRRAGMGLWLARQLCHQLEMSRAEEGFTVRLTTAVPEPAVAGLERAARAQDSAEAFKARAAKARDRAAELLRRYDMLAASASALERRWALRQTPTPRPRRDDPAEESGCGRQPLAGEHLEAGRACGSTEATGAPGDGAVVEPSIVAATEA